MQNWKKQLGAQAQFDIVAINYFGDPYTEEDGTRIISAKLSDNQKDDFGRYTFLKSVLDNDYDIIFILQDLGVTIGLVPHLKKYKEEKKAANKPNFKSIFYFPVDSALVPTLTKGLEFFDVLATYTEFGRKEVLIQRPDLKFPCPKLKFKYSEMNILAVILISLSLRTLIEISLERIYLLPYLAFWNTRTNLTKTHFCICT